MLNNGHNTNCGVNISPEVVSHSIQEYERISHDNQEHELEKIRIGTKSFIYGIIMIVMGWQIGKRMKKRTEK